MCPHYVNGMCKFYEGHPHRWQEFVSVFSEHIKNKCLDSENWKTYCASYRSLEDGETHASNVRKAFAEGGGGGRCYVATCVYGTYDCPEVWMLRRFRDNNLAESRFGRCFVHIYYAISPSLVKRFNNKAWFIKLCKPVVDLVVSKLRNQSVDDSPYLDKTNY